MKIIKSLVNPHNPMHFHLKEVVSCFFCLATFHSSIRNSIPVASGSFQCKRERKKGEGTIIY